MLERKTYVAMKDWIDESGVCYVVYPKMQLMRDLGCTLYRLDQTMEELKKHDLICIIPTNGKPLLQWHWKIGTEKNFENIKLTICV